MWAVPPEQRPSSQALLVITMHLCGDVPAPPLVGALQGTARPPIQTPVQPQQANMAFTFHPDLPFSRRGSIAACCFLQSLAVDLGS